jgi:hypothetical protein
MTGNMEVWSRGCLRERNFRIADHTVRSNQRAKLIAMAKAIPSRCLPFMAALLLVAIIPAQSRSNSPASVWVALCASTQPTQPNSRCTTIAINYVGKTDRPVFPIIISTSPEEAEWYKQRLFSDPGPTFADVYIVATSTMEEISDMRLPVGDMERPISRVRPRTSPALDLVLATGHDSKEVTFEASESALLLREIKKRASEYPPLLGRLADIEGRMNRYLKESHFR